MVFLQAASPPRKGSDRKKDEPGTIIMILVISNL